VFVLVGLFFFLTSAIGLIRFPDFFSRLHAVTKADNTGLGILAAGLALKSQDLHNAAILAVIWLLVMAAGTTCCQLLARYQVEQEDQQ
jgi:multicomponent Na+:H+ antiporter subunit G